jgi:hypothetical protein
MLVSDAAFVSNVLLTLSGIANSVDKTTDAVDIPSDSFEKLTAGDPITVRLPFALMQGFKDPDSNEYNTIDCFYIVIRRGLILRINFASYEPNTQSVLYSIDLVPTRISTKITENTCILSLINSLYECKAKFFTEPRLVDITITYAFISAFKSRFCTFSLALQSDQIIDETNEIIESVHDAALLNRGVWGEKSIETRKEVESGN